MTSFTPTTLNYPQLADTAIRRVKQNHRPNQTENFILGDEWLDTSDTPNGQWWKLDKINTGGLIWVRIGGGLGNVQSLTGNVGGAVGPDDNANINTIGITPYIVTGNPATHTLTWSDNGTIAYQYTTNNGIAVPAGNNLNVLGDGVLSSGISTAGNIFTTGSGSTITVQPTQAQFMTNYTNVTHAMSPYTVLATDNYISVDCSLGVVSLLFPNAPTSFRTWIVKDRTGNSFTNNITITSVGGAINFDGIASLVMDSNYMSLNLLANATPTYEAF
jgi:hypothetical protein